MLSHVSPEPCFNSSINILPFVPSSSLRSADRAACFVSDLPALMQHAGVQCGIDYSTCCSFVVEAACGGGRDEQEPAPIVIRMYSRLQNSRLENSPKLCQ